MREFLRLTILLQGQCFEAEEDCYLMKEVYQSISPMVYKKLGHWKEQAKDISNLELKEQAKAINSPHEAKKCNSMPIQMKGFNMNETDLCI